MLSVINILRFLVVLIIGSNFSAAAAINYRENAVYGQAEKRPFCNAFTGCGRKRSDTSLNDADRLSPIDAQPTNDKLGDLIDLNSEPAVEDLMRQIMSQAKLWEAIQEANHEIVMQKTGGTERFPMSFSAQ